MDASFLVRLLTRKLWNLGGGGGGWGGVVSLELRQQQPYEPANVYATAKEFSSLYYSFSVWEVACDLRVAYHCEYES